MNNVRRTLNRYTNFIDDKTIKTDLEQVIRQSDNRESDNLPPLSQKATEFLEKLEKRKNNQLWKLSTIQRSEVKCNQSDVQSDERFINPQSAC